MARVAAWAVYGIGSPLPGTTGRTRKSAWGFTIHLPASYRKYGISTGPIWNRHFARQGGYTLISSHRTKAAALDALTALRATEAK